MEFVGNKNEVYLTRLPETEQYPELEIADFQRLFHFLSDESEPSLVHQVQIARLMVHCELAETLSMYANLAALSLQRFGETQTGELLYRQAVFALAASFIVANQISTDTTAEAAERQDALDNKRHHCSVQSRRAIDLLIHHQETYRFEVV